MKMILPTLGACLLCCLSTAKAQEPVGRFLLVNGAVMSDGKEEKTMMRIDTVTGDTWQYVTLPVFTNKDGSQIVVFGWSKLEENASAKWREQRKMIKDASKTPATKQP